MTLSEAVRRRRLELGLSQKAVAEQAGVALLTVRRLEAGRTVRALSLQRLDRVLNWPQGTALALLEGRTPPAPDGGSDAHIRGEQAAGARHALSLLMTVLTQGLEQASDQELVMLLRQVADEQARRLA